MRVEEIKERLRVIALAAGNGDDLVASAGNIFGSGIHHGSGLPGNYRLYFTAGELVLLVVVAQHSSPTNAAGGHDLNEGIPPCLHAVMGHHVAGEHHEVRLFFIKDTAHKVIDRLVLGSVLP